MRTHLSHLGHAHSGHVSGELFHIRASCNFVLIISGWLGGNGVSSVSSSPVGAGPVPPGYNGAELLARPPLPTARPVGAARAGPAQSTALRS